MTAIQSILGKKNMVNLQSIAFTSKGTRRSENQDNYIVVESQSFNIYAIFDGVGGSLNGLKASLFAKKFVLNNYKSFIHETSVRLDDLFFEANNALSASQLYDALTTYCAAVIFPGSNEIFYSSMGDSRMYVLSNQYINQITTDNRLLNNTVTKCLGMHDLVRKDFKQSTVPKNDHSLLLCTDGFYNLLEENKLHYFELLQGKSLSHLKQNLISSVKGRNYDDATLIYIR